MEQTPKFYAIVGMTGSGKSEIVKLLEEHGFVKVHFGGVVTDETRKKGLELTEENEKIARMGLREKYGMAAIAILLLPKIEELLSSGKDVVGDGLYSWEEYKVLKDKFGDQMEMIAVHASPKTRYARLLNREYRPFSNADAQKRDYNEIQDINKGGPICMADFHFVNESGLEELRAEVLEKLEL